MPPRSGASPRTLELRTARDFFLKLEREIDRLKDANATEDVIDHATNAAMTAWHLTEWVWHDIQKDKNGFAFRETSKFAGSSIRSLSDLQEFVRTAREIAYCEAIAVSTKHFGSSGPEFTSSVRSRTEETHDLKKATALSFSVGPLGTEIRHLRRYSDLVLIERDSTISVSEILGGALEWWRNFLDRIQLQIE